MAFALALFEFTKACIGKSSFALRQLVEWRRLLRLHALSMNMVDDHALVKKSLVDKLLAQPTFLYDRGALDEVHISYVKIKALLREEIDELFWMRMLMDGNHAPLLSTYKLRTLNRVAHTWTEMEPRRRFEWWIQLLLCPTASALTACALGQCACTHKQSRGGGRMHAYGNSL